MEKEKGDKELVLLLIEKGASSVINITSSVKAKMSFL
jgi:hypothetical protein